MKRISVKILIAVTITLSMTLLATTLIYQGYRGMQEGIVEVADQASRQLSATVNERILRLLEPSRVLIRMLSYDPLVNLDQEDQRLKRVSVLAEVINASAIVSAVYIGYANKDFMLLRSLDSSNLLESFNAPEHSAFLLQTVFMDSEGNREGVWRFYNADLMLLESREIPSYDFDPQTRVWYQKAIESKEITLTAPYLFFTTQEVGITMSMAVDNNAVIGIDATVMELSIHMDALKLSESTEVAIINRDFSLIAYPDIERFIFSDQNKTRIATLDELNVPIFMQLIRNEMKSNQLIRFIQDGKPWYGMISPLTAIDENDLKMLIAIPSNELLENLTDKVIGQVKWAFAITLVLIMSGWSIGNRIGNPIAALADQVRQFKNLDFSNRVFVRSRLREVNQLSRVLDDMSATIRHFKSLSIALNQERDPDRLLQMVLKELVLALGQDKGCIYLYEAERKSLVLSSHMHEQSLPQYIDVNAQHETTEEVKERIRKSGYEFYVCSVLKDRHGRLLGALIIDNDKSTNRDIEGVRQFVDEISGAMAVAIETRQMLREQKAMIDGIIRLIADAIDAKSPYTSGHCERVPELAIMISNAAQLSQEAEFKDYYLSEADQEAFRIAAWLHDCGKIIIPEYVVDKATKLETIYNRIHEIRTRFEVLYRDAEITFLKGCLEGKDIELLRQERDNLQQQLQEEFNFIALSNEGGEFISEQDVEKIKQIGARQWLRNFSNRIGLSRNELERVSQLESETLPVTEHLLSDRPEQIFPWRDRKPPVNHENPDNRWGFNMRLPEVSFNQGEIYNLSISRGTLTEEERFKINEHIVQTIIMLDTLPLPEHLKSVPAIAGNHHERLDGKGYPRGLSKSDLSLQERIMAVADVFEALTAEDRPYKHGKTLSESLKIMQFMVQDQHLDGEVFQLFLRSGVCMHYAQAYLNPDQIDVTDLSPWMG